MIDTTLQDSIEIIQNVFEEYNIYRCILIYENVSIYQSIKNYLETVDFTFIENTNESGRVYALHVDCFDDLSNTKYDFIDWNTITLVLCLGETAYDMGKAFFLANSGIEHVVKV